MKFSKQTVAGLVAMLALSAVGYLWGPDAVKLVRSSVDTAPVVSGMAPVDTSSVAPTKTG